MSSCSQLGYIYVCVFAVVQCCTVKLEAEHGSTTGTQMYRSKASDGITVLLKEDDYIRYEFMTYSDCMLNIRNVAYSNDGASDTVTLSVNNTLVGSFKSVAQTGGGDLWNEFRSSGPVGNETEVVAGDHTLTLVAVSADEYGVEIDALTLAFACTSKKSTTKDCPESEVKFNGTQGGFPDDESGGGGLNTDTKIAIVFGVVGSLLAVPGCIAGVCAIRRRKNKDFNKLVTSTDD